MESKIAKYLAQAKALYNKLDEEHRSLVSDVKQHGFEDYEVFYSNPQRADDLSHCNFVMLNVIRILEAWEPAQHEDAWKSIRLHNLGVDFIDAYREILKVDCDEARHIQLGIEKLNQRLSIVPDLKVQGALYYY